MKQASGPLLAHLFLLMSWKVVSSIHVEVFLLIWWSPARTKASRWIILAKRVLLVLLTGEQRIILQSPILIIC